MSDLPSVVVTEQSVHRVVTPAPLAMMCRNEQFAADLVRVTWEGMRGAAEELGRRNAGQRFRLTIAVELEES